MKKAAGDGSMIWLLSLFLTGISITLFPSETAFAWTGDYNPVTDNYQPVGPGGAWVQNQGTWLDSHDAVVNWNAWTQNSKLQEGAPWCGVYASCIIYGFDSDLDTGIHWLTGTNCPIANSPPFENGVASWATTFFIFSGTTNMWRQDLNPDLWEQCRNLSPPGGPPIFIVAFNEEVGHTSNQLKHIARHEMGHALGLGHAEDAYPPGHECYSIFLFDQYFLMPLMQGRSTNCPPQNGLSFGDNFTATVNEGGFVKIRQSW